MEHIRVLLLQGIIFFIVIILFKITWLAKVLRNFILPPCILTHILCFIIFTLYKAWSTIFCTEDLRELGTIIFILLFVVVQAPGHAFIIRTAEFLITSLLLYRRGITLSHFRARRFDGNIAWDGFFNSRLFINFYDEARA